MKRLITASVFVLGLSFVLFFPRLNADTDLDFPDSGGALISMDFKDVSLRDALKAFSIQSGMNFLASEGVQERKITLYFDKVPLKEAMNKLFEANNLSYVMDPEAKIFIVKDWGKVGPELLTQVFYLKHATVSTSSLKQEMSDNLAGTSGTTGSSSSSSSSSTSGSSSGSSGGDGKYAIEEDSGITRAVKKLLTAEIGLVVEDFRTNSLIVTDTPAKLKVVAMVIDALDVAVPQIMLEVEMLDVNKNVTEKLGIKHNGSLLTATWTPPTPFKTMFPFPHSGLNVSGKNQDIPVAAGQIGLTSTYNMTLDFLRSLSDTKQLARPKIMTLNNETAEIKITTQETVGITTVVSGGGQGIESSSTEAERMETGVSLRVTPQIDLERREITMFIMPSVKDTTNSSIVIPGGGGAFYKDPEERTTKSVVKVKDGETIVLGGLIRKRFSETDTKVPFLGEIPFIGALFRHKNVDQNAERELLVFITPHIIDDTALVAPARKLSQLPKDAPNVAVATFEREQGVVSGGGRVSQVTSDIEKFEN